MLGTLVGLCVLLAYATTAAVARLTGAADPGAALRQGVDGGWLALALDMLDTRTRWWSPSRPPR